MWTTRQPRPSQVWIASMTSRFGGIIVPSGAKSWMGPGHLIEHKDRRPAMVMYRFFLIRLQNDLEDTEPVVLK